ncbi:MAG: rod shape-determining protein RodA [Desulfotomaculales bacterium]
MRGKKLLRNLDFTLMLAVAGVVSLGLVTIASATHATGGGGADSLYYVKMQLVWICLGLIILGAILLWRYEELAKYSRLLYAVNLVMLGAVLVVGREALGAQRWIQIGPFSFQPSEFAKLFMIITLATFLSKREGRLKRFRDLLPVFAYVALPMLLILKQPDLGTSLVFLAITFGMLFVAGVRPSLLVLLGGGGAVGMGFWIWAALKYGVWIPLKDYQLTRLTIFLDPWQDWQGAGYHMIQSQIAIGSGGPLGRGLFNGTQNQLNFLPEQHTDFIFSAFAEEWGFAGALVLLCLLFIVLYRALRIALHAKDTFGTLMATGIASMLIFHILINIGMTMGIMPVTGIPLPFFSYGGSAMLTNMSSLGLLLNIWVRRRQIIF